MGVELSYNSYRVYQNPLDSYVLSLIAHLLRESVFFERTNAYYQPRLLTGLSAGGGCLDFGAGDLGLLGFVTSMRVKRNTAAM